MVFSPDLIPDDKARVMREAMLVLNTADPAKRDIAVTTMIKSIRSKKRADDIERVADVLEVWESKEPVPVGESGTLYRYFSFRDFFELARGMTHKPREFLLTGTLKTRHITRDPDMINWSQEKLLTLDNQTSQFASAAALMGDPARITNPPFRLQQTYDIIDTWNGIKPNWQPQKDETILLQTKAFYALLNGKQTSFTVRHSEDVPFGLAFGFIGFKDAAKKFPSVLGHESNRITEMQQALADYAADQIITSNDHRVVQALAMKAAIENRKTVFSNRECVTKSWPEFWNFLQAITYAT